MMSLDGLFKEGSSGEIGAEKGINGLVVLIDSPIELVSATSNRNRCLVHTPRRVHTPGIARPALLELRDIPLHPAQTRRVGDDHAPLRHHLDQIPVAQPIREVPTHA